MQNNSAQTQANYNLDVDIKPDGLTFAVWGVIYLLETFFVITQVYLAFCGGESSLWITNGIRITACIAFALNGIWLPLDATGMHW